MTGWTSHGTKKKWCTFHGIFMVRYHLYFDQNFWRGQLKPVTVHSPQQQIIESLWVDILCRTNQRRIYLFTKILYLGFVIVIFQLLSQSHRYGSRSCNGGEERESVL